ncbi:Ground domain-containing protein [Trichostrongylus colubriformis]|uniref:Ground domain-containing protein n=1 Tax=Trichostrongylus colubriformis TaxID=6319 RepID=A0AAN8FMP6_TRICO
MGEVRTEQKFNRTFETVVAYDDFAQKVHFSSDLICKVELGGRYMLAYATARGVQEPQLPPIYGKPQAGPVTEGAHAISRKYAIVI